MGYITIRNIDDRAIRVLGDMAKKKGMSKSAFLKLQLETLAISGEVKNVENKYEILIQQILEQLEFNNEVIERNTLVLKEVLENC